MVQFSRISNILWYLACISGCTCGELLHWKKGVHFASTWTATSNRRLTYTIGTRVVCKWDFISQKPCQSCTRIPDTPKQWDWEGREAPAGDKGCSLQGAWSHMCHIGTSTRQVLPWRTWRWCVGNRACYYYTTCLPGGWYLCLPGKKEVPSPPQRTKIVHYHCFYWSPNMVRQHRWCCGWQQ